MVGRTLPDKAKRSPLLISPWIRCGGSDATRLKAQIAEQKLKKTALRKEFDEKFLSTLFS
jgi:hypothetical protein